MLVCGSPTLAPDLLAVELLAGVGGLLLVLLEAHRKDLAKGAHPDLRPGDQLGG